MYLCITNKENAKKLKQNRYKDMYIEKIKSPAFLKGLNLEELNIVADETRQAVLNRVSKHGGQVDRKSVV